MKRGEGPRWPYLSPARAGWTKVPGERGRIRRLASRQNCDDSNNPSAVVLDTIEALNQVVRLIENDLVGLVTEAHYRGVSWQEIAERLDRSKQAVHQRYQGKVHARATHAMLRDDLAEALRWARELARHRTADDCSQDEARRVLGEFRSAREGRDGELPE